MSLMARRSALKSFYGVIFLLMSHFLDDLFLPPPLDEVTVFFPLSFGLWRTHWTFPAWCFLHRQYSFPSLVFLLPVLSLTESRIGYTWCRMDLPLLTPWWVSLVTYLIHLHASGPLQIDPGSDHTWDPCWTASLR